MKNITIVSTHANVTEAVAASGIDFSYNLKAAADEARDLDRGYRGAGRNVLRPVTKAFVADVDGRRVVLYVLECEERGGFIRFLNEFTPFHHCLDDCDFSVRLFKDGEFVQQFACAKGPANRKFLAFACSHNPDVYVC